jgi:hypothetical protein
LRIAITGAIAGIGADCAELPDPGSSRASVKATAVEHGLNFQE